MNLNNYRWIHFEVGWSYGFMFIFEFVSPLFKFFNQLIFFFTVKQIICAVILTKDQSGKNSYVFFSIELILPIFHPSIQSAIIQEEDIFHWSQYNILKSRIELSSKALGNFVSPLYINSGRHIRFPPFKKNHYMHLHW